MESLFEEGLTPLLDSPEKRQGEVKPPIYLRTLKRDKVPLTNPSPLSLRRIGGLRG